MAKFGIALGSGPRGLGFESRYSDHRKALEMYVSGAFSYFLRQFYMLSKLSSQQFICSEIQILVYYDMR